MLQDIITPFGEYEYDPLEVGVDLNFANADLEVRKSKFIPRNNVANLYVVDEPIAGSKAFGDFGEGEKEDED